jgi:hypothetical protein
MLSMVNIHMNIAPLFLASILLLPSGLISLLSFNLPFGFLAGIIVLLNFGAWFFLYKWGGLESAGQRHDRS